MGKLLTIVVPMYNVENYIEKCLDSFVISEIMDYLEVLIINDGTPDSSREKAAVYERKYPQVFRIVDKENGGHGSAINRGIEEAAGAYFKVVDGDDWVDSEGLVHLIDYLRESTADMVLTNYYWVDDVTGRRSKEVDELCPGIAYRVSYPFEEISDKIFMKMPAISFRTEILRQQQERLDEHCSYVDTEYILFPLPYVKTVAALPDFIYQYRLGIPGQSMSLENMRKRCRQHERVLFRLLRFYCGIEGQTCEAAVCNMIGRMVASQYKIYLSFPKSHKKNMLLLEKKLKKEYPKIYQAVRRPSVLLLRWSRYLLYPVASLALRVSQRK